MCNFRRYFDRMTSHARVRAQGFLDACHECGDYSSRTLRLQFASFSRTARMDRISRVMVWSRAIPVSAVLYVMHPVAVSLLASKPGFVLGAVHKQAARS